MQAQAVHDRDVAPPHVKQGGSGGGDRDVDPRRLHCLQHAVGFFVADREADDARFAQADVVDPNDVEMLEDLIVAAVNEARNKAQELMGDEMSKLTGGIKIPGMM